MKPEASILEELIEKYRYWIGGILILAIVGGSAVLIWRENYWRPGLEDRVANLEGKIDELEESQKVVSDTPTASNQTSNVQAPNSQTESQGQVAGAATTSQSQKTDAESPVKITGKININTANASELDALPGIGSTYAQRIIEYREANGGFKSIEDIKNVKGIGEKTFEKFKDQITI